MQGFKSWAGACAASGLLAASAFVHAAAPQSAAAIRGIVNDALGRPLAGVALSLRTAAGQVVGRAQSGADGRFAFADLAAGVYAVVGDKSGFQSGTAIVTVAASAEASATLTLASQQALEITVAAERLDRARNALSPKTGGSLYRFGADDVAALPEGANTSFNQVLLQAPGVANDVFGQLYVRGDHANLQYRIDGVILPEGITGFGQALDTRFAKRIDLMTGALPAQYGYRTAGVVEIETKTRFAEGGRIDLYGGARGTVNPSFEYGNSKDNASYYVTGSWLANNVGVENPAPSVDPLHDRTTQFKGFGYASYLVDAATRISAMVGSYDGKFQVPNRPGETPDPNGQGFLAGAGVAGFDSARLDERQRETNRYGILALQSTVGADFDYQLALFTRYSSVRFTPDPVGDLVFNGIASNVLRSSSSTGLQADGSYRLDDAHTLRLGGFFSSEDVRSDNSSVVFPVDGAGNVNGPARTVVDNNPKNGNRLLGLYLQDEWKATDKLTVNYGARFDRLDAFVAASQLSPRLGVVYQANPQTTLHAGYARYFTPPPTELVSPTTVALFAGTSGAPSVAQNSPVKAERAHYVDVGMTHQATPALNVGIDAFYKRIADLLDEGQFGQALIFAPFNYAQGKIYGVELSANYRSGDFAAYANLARTTSLARQVSSAQFNFGREELDYIASNWVSTDHDQRYTASAGVSRLWAGTRYSADAIFGSGLRRGFANTDHQPAYTQVNVGASRRFDTPALGTLEGRVAVVNLFDKIYEIRDGSGIGVGAPRFGPRRGLYAGVSRLF